MTDVVITEVMDQAAVSQLAGRFRIHYDPDLADKPDPLAVLAGEARALIVRNRTQVRGALLDGAGRLACVGRLGVGLDNIDMEACARRDIAVYPAVGANALAVAEYVVASVLTLFRGAYGATAEMVAGRLAARGAGRARNGGQGAGADRFRLDRTRDRAARRRDGDAGDRP